MKKLLLLLVLTFLCAQPSFAEWYIFKHDTGKCASKSTYKPDEEDMASRGEYAVESNAAIELKQAQIVNGEVVEIPKPAEDLQAEADAKQEALEHAILHERMEKIAYESMKADGYKFKMHKDSDFVGK